MTNRTIEAVLRLSAKLGSMGAFTTLSGKMAQVDAAAKRYNRSQRAAAAATLAQAAALRTTTSAYTASAAALARFAGPAVVGYGAFRATQGYAGLERRLTRIGINADASGEAVEDAMARIRGIADDLHTPVGNVVSGLESLIASGKSLEEAMALLPSVSATAQAADADFQEMASTADAISSAFGIASDRMSGSFDIIAMGGKAGKFELKDMAAELPSLAPAFAALGYRGEEGLRRLTAALQVVRMEVGTSGEAATSFMDVISKMETDTVSNNFKKFGIDIRREMKRARAAGEDTLEAFIRLAREAVDGDMSKLPQLFTDKQMLIGMRALMNRTGSLRDLFLELGNAAGTVNTDIARLANDAQADIDKLANSWDRLLMSMGKGVVSAGGVDALNSVSDAIDYATAVNAGLEASGAAKGFWERTKWGVTHSQAEKDAMAFLGGYRSDADKRLIAGYKAYEEGRIGADTPVRDVTKGPEIRSLPETGPVPVSRDGKPYIAANNAGIPLPMSRPNDVDIAIDRAEDARLLARQYGQYRPGQMRERLAFAPPAYYPPRTKGGYSDVAPMAHRALPDSGLAVRFGSVDPLGQAIADAASELTRGGEDAASALSSAAPQVGATIGDAAAAKIAADAALAGSLFGEAAAAKIRAAVPRTSIVSGNPGRTMPSAGDVVATP